MLIAGDTHFDIENNGSSFELELVDLHITPSPVPSKSPTSELVPIPTPNGGLSDSDVKRTITAYMTMKREDSTSSQVSVPRLLRHFSNTSAISAPPTALSRPLTTSTRPVTSSTKAATSSDHRNNPQDVVHKAIGQKKLRIWYDVTDVPNNNPNHSKS